MPGSDPDAHDYVSRGWFGRRFRWRWCFVVAFVLTLILGLWRAREGNDMASRSSAISTSPNGPSDVPALQPAKPPWRFNPPDRPPPRTAAEIVTAKVGQFGRSRREMARATARRLQKDMPPEVEKFFDAVESGNWDAIKAAWDPLAAQSGQYERSTNRWEELNPYWPAVLDAYGVAEQAHLWPPQQLLDYGNAILGSLRPGMVYVGGTDNGRWIPELLNETAEGEQHIIVTQNALADARYVDFVNELYADRMTTLTSADSQRIFQEYVADAQKRLEHDQQFPDEPKQVRPGENISIVDGKTQVSGQVAVMAINEKLLQFLMARNPELSFAIQESFPFKDTYADALPLGPLMELGGRNDENAFSADRAGQSIDYWRNATQAILSDPQAAGSESTLRSYSHDAAATANLLAAHNFSAEAEAAYRLSAQLWPGNPESANGLANCLAASGRTEEAQQLLDDFAKKFPDTAKALEQMSAIWTLRAGK